MTFILMMALNLTANLGIEDDDRSNEEIVEKKKNIQARNGTVAKTTTSYTNSYL